MNETKHISERAYPHAEIEVKWQRIWEERGTYKFHWTPPLTHPQAEGKNRPKFYVLTMFSYPSGDKLHMGHWYCYAPADTFARFKRMQGHEVFEPMGFDAFGLPAENYAIKTGIHPRISTEKNVAFMREQLKRIGAMYDWDYEVNTSSPEYYKWTQWWFLLMYKRGLAYRKEALVNWCPDCQTVLANEQVKADNTCERCGNEVARKSLRQWFFRITEYSQRLLDGLETINWPEKTKAMQRYWIGKSEGTEIEFKIRKSENPKIENEGRPNDGEGIRVFTTRADTLFGVTYVVLAPEHSLVHEVTTEDRKAEVEGYVARALAVSDVERAAADRPKTGVFTGGYCEHPLTHEKLPIWVADYVIGTYGTGAVMAVPAHDERDFDFAKKYGLEIREVIRPTPPSPPASGGGSERHTPPYDGSALPGGTTPVNGGESERHTTPYDGSALPCGTTPASGGELEEAFTDYGVMVGSEEFDGLESEEGIRRVGERLEQLGLGKPTVQWHLRDWTVSRQRYWGAPIPVIHCPKCGIVPVRKEELPVLLPDDIEEFRPKGKAPLEAAESFVNAKCPKCGGAGKRDTDTLDTFVCSSWYFMRYPDARLDSAPFDTQHLNFMLPIEQYVGGSEHAMGHLLYARFFAKVAHDAGYLKCEEPFTRLVHQGMILNHGERMSKSKGNVVAPEPIIEEYGSAVLRCFLMFMGDYQQGGEWSDKGIAGVERFVARVWRLVSAIGNGHPASVTELPIELDRKLHQTILAVGNSLENFDFHGGLARLMELTNQIYAWVGSELKDVKRSPAAILVAETLLRLLAPFAPHISEELWQSLGHTTTIFDAPWPVHDEEKAREDRVTIAVQINGKLRGTVEVDMDAEESAVLEVVFGLDRLKPYLDGKMVVKRIVVPNKIVNLVVK